MEQFITFIEEYGYLAVFLGSVLEGESVVLIGGLLSHEQYLTFPLVVISAFFGALVSDWGFFFLGRKRSDFFAKYATCVTKFAKKPTAFIENNPRTASFFMRFMYGFRHVLPFSIGKSCIPIRLFLTWNSLGALAWALSISAAGYVAGNLLHPLMATMRDHELRILIFILGAIFFYILIAKASSIFILRQKKKCRIVKRY